MNEMEVSDERGKFTLSKDKYRMRWIITYAEHFALSGDENIQRVRRIVTSDPQWARTEWFHIIRGRTFKSRKLSLETRRERTRSRFKPSKRRWDYTYVI